MSLAAGAKLGPYEIQSRPRCIERETVSSAVGEVAPLR